MRDREVELALRDIKQPWRTRNKVDREVTGAIELAWYRGYQTGLKQGLAVRKSTKPAARVRSRQEDAK